MDNMKCVLGHIDMNKKCPLCDSQGFSIVEKYGAIGPAKFGCEMARCNSCGHYFSCINQEIDFEQLYNAGKYQINDTRGSLFDRALAIDDELIFRQLSKMLISNKSLLDFGCGKGQFLHRALLRGWKVKGIETARKRAEFGIDKYGLDVSTDEYNGGPLEDGPFDVITLFHVLEHLPAPEKLLKELVSNNLTPDGCVIVEVPLFGSIQSQLAGKRWIHLDPPLHLSHFTKNTLLQLLENLELKPTKIEYLSIHLGILGMVQSIMSLFGYEEDIIYELKHKRTLGFIISILLVLPFAVFLELISVILHKGGVIRVYCHRATCT